ncbi:hypothetical protein H2201_005838 [Coniosporium apollinis]|uniref:Uncharacterized protein n=1 Tax=Coniosporium apollinis TaxID=61459 RepID=A0ABQ9NNM0_9PEZI|nr:hypothetical protein H2201_005838 [Coniosporium apollinis]
MREGYARWQLRQQKKDRTLLETDKQGVDQDTERSRLWWEAKKKALVQEIEKEEATWSRNIKEEPAEEKQPRRLASNVLRKETMRSLAVARSLVKQAQRLAREEVEMKRAREEAEMRRAEEGTQAIHVQQGPTKSSRTRARLARQRAREEAEAKAGEERPGAAEVLGEVPKQRYNWAQDRHRWEWNKRKLVKAKKVDGKTKPAGMRQQRRLPSLNEGLIRSVRTLGVQAKNHSLKSVNWGIDD